MYARSIAQVFIIVSERSSYVYAKKAKVNASLFEIHFADTKARRSQDHNHCLNLKPLALQESFWLYIEGAATIISFLGCVPSSVWPTLLGEQDTLFKLRII